MEHFSEVLKLVEGGLTNNPAKVRAYAELLQKKLETEGHDRSAKALAKLLAGGAGKHLHAARIGPMPLPVDSESRLALADEEMVHANEVQVFLSASTRTRVGEFVEELRHADELVRSGVGISPTLLMYGPPGCGKTETARFIAAELGVPLLTARSDSLISSFLGSTSKNVRLLFEHATSRPCVLFLDEFDALAKLRDDQRELGELKRVVISLLQNIDALRSGTVLLAATNHEHLLDRAVWRRFAHTLHVGLPDEQARADMLKEFLGDLALPFRMSHLVEGTANLSGAEIRQLCEETRRRAVLNGNASTSEENFLRRLLRLRLPHLEHMPPEVAVVEARELHRRLFTVRRLSGLLGISTGKISALTKESEHDAAK